MMISRRQATLGFIALGSAGLTACSSLAPATDAAGSTDSRRTLQGRLALTVHSESPQRLSASFELQGSMQQGRLSLFTPLGTLLHELAWAPGQAQLRSANPVATYPDLASLLRSTLGVDLPLAAFFDWLNGQDSPAPGWELQRDPAQAHRFRALRNNPSPSLEIRIILESQ